MEKPYITNPVHGGKVTCHKCKGFIEEGSGQGYSWYDTRKTIPKAWFHNGCYNPYEHYYGLDKPID